MAKGLRSKTKRAFRTAKRCAALPAAKHHSAGAPADGTGPLRATLAATPAMLKAEDKRQKIMDGVVAQSRALQVRPGHAWP